MRARGREERNRSPHLLRVAQTHRPQTSLGFAIALLRSRLKGRRILVVGSAPDPALPDPSDFDAVVCVNASGDVARRRLGLSADLTVMDREMTTLNGPGEKREAAFNLVRPLDLGLVVTVASNAAQLNSSSLAALRNEGHVSLTRRQTRRALQRAASDRRLNSSIDALVSTGFSAMALAALGRPKTIWLAGFRLFVPAGSHGTPHDYPMPRIDKVSPYRQDRSDGRKHSLADAALLSGLALSGLDVRSHEIELAPLLSNRGSRGRASRRYGRS